MNASRLREFLLRRELRRILELCEDPEEYGNSSEAELNANKLNAIQRIAEDALEITPNPKDEALCR